MSNHDQNLQPLSIEQLCILAPKMHRVLLRLELTAWLLSLEGQMPDDIKAGAFASFIEDVKNEAGEVFNFVEPFSSHLTLQPT